MASGNDTYAHRLHDTGDRMAERMLERSAQRYALKRDSGASTDSLVADRLDVITRALRFFYVTGPNLVGRAIDEPLEDTILYCVEHFDPSRGTFVRLVRFKYKRTRSVLAEGEDKAQENIVELIEGSGDDTDASTPNELLASDERDDPESAIARQAKVDAAIAKFLSLVEGFLEHAPDKRKYTERNRLYLRMNIAEWATYAVMSQPHVAYVEPLERQERRIFSSMERPFLDTFVEPHARSVRDLFGASLVKGAGEIVTLDDPRIGTNREPAPWKLPLGFYLAYLQAQGIAIKSSSTVSEHRAKFDDLRRSVLTTGDARKQ